MNELTKIVDLSQYGLEEKKAAEIRKDFDAVLKIAEELESDFNAVIAVEEITPELAKNAKALRLKYVKVRTGIAAVHKERKAFYLSGGRAVDGLKNAYTHAVEGNEAKLAEIETHFERIEAERVKKLQSERALKLSLYVEDASERDLVKFADDEFEALLSMKKKEHEDRIAAEKKVIEDRIAAEKAEAAERERVRKENETLKAEAEAREKAAIAERAEREKAEKELAAERAERERIEAAAKAKEEAERKERESAAAREKDTENKKRVHNDALESIVALGIGISNAQAKDVVIAIAKGHIKNVAISY